VGKGRAGRRPARQGEEAAAGEEGGETSEEGNDKEGRTADGRRAESLIISVNLLPYPEKRSSRPIGVVSARIDVHEGLVCANATLEQTA
jgi:hypothetical protein